MALVVFQFSPKWDKGREMATIVELKGEHQEFRADSETTDMALFVRTSDESMQGWDRRRIVDALVRETYVDFDTAKEIAREVEDLIAAPRSE